MKNQATVAGDIPNQLIGSANEADIRVDDINCRALLDTGSMVTTMVEWFCKKHFKEAIIPLENIIQVKSAGGHSLPYLGYVEAVVELPNCLPCPVPILVVPEDSYNCSVPVLVGTNVLDTIVDNWDCSSVPTSGLCLPVAAALRAIQLKKRHLTASAGVYAVVRCTEAITLEARQVQFVKGVTRVTTPIPNTVALLETSTGESTVEVTPSIVDIGNSSSSLDVELSNTSSHKTHIAAGSVIAQLHQVQIQDSPQDHPPMKDFLGLFSLEKDLKDLPDDQVERVKKLLVRWQGVFSLGETDIGHTDLVEHRIDLVDNIPFKDRPRRIPPGAFEEIRQHLRGLLDSGVIRESCSPWASNIVLVRKKDQKLRMCIDYRRLNTRTIKDAYSIPRIEDTLHLLRGSRFFSSLDMRSSYHQVEIAEEHKCRTAFTVGALGFYEFNRLAFGLTNSPSTYQRLMERILKEEHLKSCVIYLDDVVVFGTTFEEHLERLEQVFRRLQEASLKLKPSKCHFLQTRIQYLGHIVSEDGIELDSSNVSAILDFPPPENHKELQRFLGMAGFHRKFVENYAAITRPLTKLLRGNKKGIKKAQPPEWYWGTEQLTAFNNIKRLLTTPPVLAYPDFERPFLLRTDASGSGLGAVLCQEEEGNVRVIGYGSRCLKKTEENYSAYKLEFLALYWAVTKKFKDYLYGQRFIVTTDHNPLVYVFTTPNLDATGHRWMADLATFDFDIKYKPGSTNQDADASTRQPLWS